ncbi:PBECR4 domain-containing protein [Streptococcus agalactiae]|uniref:PBECR4 domain-containing protein n=1 Tax=Streptococcus agalactiae TaxID=1311 RepID=UPI001303574C|nr:PBECR4 domain-containing protein [Streptococcus agalactiae]KAF0052064.1 ImmA/IrrE family metallo-endopeptidase [Streptococcus agalactiae]
MTKSLTELKQLSILDIAQSLGMTLIKDTNHQYHWKEHDSLKIYPDKNTFAWYRKDEYGDVISLVQAVKGDETGEKVSFKEAKAYLETGEFKQFEVDTSPKKPFTYYLKPYEVPDFKEGRNYLKNDRGLSDETIDFFYQKGVLAQAHHMTGDYREPVIVFKTLNSQGQVTGGSLQGIRYNPSMHDRGRLKRLMRASDGLSGMHVDIGKPNRLVVAEAPIDLMSYYELHKDNLNDVRLLAMDGLKQATIGRHLAEIEAMMANRPIPWSPQELGQSLAKAIKEGYFQREENNTKITLVVDNDKGGRNFIKKLQDRGISLQVDIPKLEDGEKKADWNDALKKSKENKMSEGIKKVPDKHQEQEMDRSNMSWGSLQDNPEGSAEPVSKDTFEQTVTSHPTVSYPFLKFSTSNGFVSTVKEGYHIATEDDLRSLNYYASSLQETAQWYLNTIANSEVTYFYKNGDDIEAMRVNYGKEKFVHLTGIRPTGRDLTAEKVLERFAYGQGKFDNVTVSRSFVDKLQVLPLFQEIVQSKSFVFDDIKDIKKMKSIKADTAIRTENKQLLVAFRTIGDVTFPVSLLKPNHSINLNLENKQDENVILGVFRKSEGQVERLSINKDYIKDDGKELLSLLENGELEEVLEAEKEEAVFQEKLSDNLSSTLDREEETVSDLIAQKDTKALSRHFKKGVKSYLNSKNYKTFLKGMSKFHTYSPRNIQLILAQNPKASQVASFKSWKENFERTVTKGEKSLRIFAPMLIKQRDPETGKVLLDKEGKEQTRTTFKLVPVFDVSQTQGKELPRPIYELEGKHEDYQNIYRATKAFAKSKDVTLTFDKNLTTSNGYYSPKNKSIVIKSGMSPQQTLKTIFHELAHMDLKHDPKNININQAELQAESVAYVVASHFGFDTSDYSFGYLASWSEDKETLETLENQLVVVQKEAKELIQHLDASLEQALSKAPKENTFENQLKQMKEISLQEAKEKATGKENNKEVDASKKQESDKEKTK